ncbi:MAG: FG-GAP-like repeat-containing protein [Chloroflexota bacterium]|jgi:alpha-tubulin suppressor-like RCC1 family protein
MPHITLHQGGRRLFCAAVFVLGVALLVIIMSPAIAQDISPNGALAQLEAMPRSLTFTFITPDYKLVTDENGMTTIELEGFFPATLPGDPNLPAALYHIALPPLVPLDSVRLEIIDMEQAEIPGDFYIPPTGPFLPAGDIEPIGVDWGPNAPTIVDGKNTTVYDENAFFPAMPVELVDVAHMRKWRIAEVRYWPVSFNPITNRIRLTTKITALLRYDPPSLKSGSLDELQDRLMDDRAQDAFLNYSDALVWYDSMITDQAKTERAKPGYAIITTNQIAAASTKLNDFIRHKEALGYSVQVVTENQYGSLTGEPPNQRSDKVRQWLGSHWKSDNLLYVLLIGNPDPFDPKEPNGSIGDMPMKMIDGTPTDFYFADLYSTDPINWDWWAEVYVGRIPVYRSDSNWAAILDGILQKSIDYETSNDVSWRRSVLLPMAFLDTGSDGAELAELMKDDYLYDTGFKTHRIYWHGTLAYSRYRSEEELVDGATANRWAKQPFGIVTWYGHGYWGGTVIYEENRAHTDNFGGVINWDETQKLDDSKPALTFQASCSTGYPENPNNMGYSLLKRGAVGTVSGSRDTYGFPGSIPGPDASNVSLAYNYIKHITENVPTGKALYWVKSSPGGDSVNALAYNLYGDPSIRLLGQNPSMALIEPGSHSSHNETGPVMDIQTAHDQDEIALDESQSINPSDLDITDRPFSELNAQSNSTAGYDGKIIANEPDRILSMGSAHNCAVKPNGDIDCLSEPWGGSYYWQDAADQTGPYRQVSAGSEHTCGLKPDGSVHCWGRNYYELAVDHAGPFTEISTKNLHVCGLQPDGDIVCWGNNDAGQAGEHTGPFIQVSAGTNFTCGLKSDGSVDCWGGDNDWGEVDDKAGPFIQITSGENHNCAIKKDGTLYCWGSNEYGQTDYPSGTFRQISAGLNHTCGITASGNVDCWGLNTDNQAEDREANEDGKFVQVTAGNYHSCALFQGVDYVFVRCWGSSVDGQNENQGDGFTQIAAGSRHTCGLMRDGTVYCWGGNSHGQADSQHLSGPYDEVSAGQYHTCGLKADGGVHCWGRNEYGQGTDKLGPYVQISANYLHTCGLQANGPIYCWGNNDAGQAEDNWQSAFIQVSTGLQHTCGLASDGSVDCWGRNSFGQANDRSGPFIQIDTGYFHTCGLKPDGSVDCWGSNHHGQANDYPGPFIQVSVGWLHTCALRRDGSVDCWGKNDYGQAVDQAGPYVRINTNKYNSVGLKADGTLDFWGAWMQAEDQIGPFGQYQPEPTRMIFTTQSFGGGMYYTAVHLADMDGNGDLEVLVGNRNSNSLEIWRYDPDPGTLVKIDSLTFPYHIHDIKAADFDGDRDIDVVVGLRSGGLYLATNTGKPGSVGSWSIRSIDRFYSWQVLVEDFDQDGKLDIFHGIDNGPIKTFYGDGKGNFEPGQSIQDPETKMRVARGFTSIDLNGDGRLDLIGADGSFLRAFLNPGDRSSAWKSVGETTSFAPYPCCGLTELHTDISPAAGDLDGNGAIDQVAILGMSGSAGPIEVLLIKGDRYDESYYWSTTVLDSILSQGFAGHAGVADLDGDGNLDIHVGGWNRFNDLHLYFGDGNGGFTKEVVKLKHGIGEFNTVAVGDLNGDGVMDIVTNRTTENSETAGGLEVLFGTLLPRNLYLPHVVQTQGSLPGAGWTTGIQLQNVGNAAADIRLGVYDADSTSYDCGSKTAAPGGSVNYLMDNACPILTAFNGSAVAASEQPMRGIIHVNNASVGQAGGIYVGTAAEDSSSTLFFPLVKHNHYGRTTTFVVQNSSNFPVNINATFRIQGGSFTKYFYGVPGNAKIVVGPADAGVAPGNGQVGSLTVSGSGPLAGSSLEHQHTIAVAQNLQATRAFTPADFDKEVYCPLFRNSHTTSRQTTGLQVQNVSEKTSAIYVTYIPRDGGESESSYQEVEAGASGTFYAPFIGVPPGSVGSVLIQSEGNVVAVVNEEGRDGGLQRTTTYACFPAGRVTNRIVLPLYKEFWIGNTSGIQIQNIGYEEASIRITYIATNRNASVTFTPGFKVPASSSTTFFGVSQKIFPPTMTVIAGDPSALANTYGSVVIESDMPIVAIANESGYGPNSSPQDNKNYEGFNQ